MKARKLKLFKSWRRRRAARHRRLEREAHYVAMECFKEREFQQGIEATALADYHEARARELDG